MIYRDIYGIKGTSACWAPLFLLDFNASVFVGEAAAAESDESVVDRSYVKKKLEHGLTRIWQVRKNSVCLSGPSEPEMFLTSTCPAV